MQNKIFPRYFIGQTITPVILGLTAPVVLTPWTIGVLATSSVGGAINYFVLLPVTHKVKAEQERLVAENRAYDDEGNPTPEYAAATKKFGKYHGMSMLANLVSIVSLGGYGILLSRKLL